MSYSDFKKLYNVNLNDQQEVAVQAVDGPVLLLAVPGSGKTTVLINRLGYMIFDQGINPENILTVTFTVAATKDMQARFESRFGEKYAKRLEFRTINSLSKKVLDYYKNIFGKIAYDVIDKKAKTLLLKKIFMRINNRFATENDVKNIETAITYVKNMRLSEEKIKKLNVDVDNFVVIYEDYQMELKKQKLIDFDDQMVYALKILQKIPRVLDFFQKQYHYICVDEAQDTSKLQHDMISLLVSKHNNVFMVGDEDQSIYGFRAAYPEALVSFERVYKGAKILLMESNYRSSEEIVNASDKFIQMNQKRHQKHMKATRACGGNVTRIETKSRKEQITYLLKVAKDCNVETAVLYRNNESVLPLIDMLERRGISYRMKGNKTTFFSHPVVNDISDFIRLALNPLDGDAFLRVYYKMGAGISKIVANKVVEYCQKKQPILDQLDEVDELSQYTKKRCRELAMQFINMRQESAGKAVYRIINCMGYGEYMRAHGMDSSKAEIMQILANQEENINNFLPRLEKLNRMVAEGGLDFKSKFILSTIHSSKGLEYDTVYMFDMLEGILPCISEPKEGNANPDDVEVYEEERRLYYVGMTRAKNSLYIFTFNDSETSAFSKEVFGIEPKMKSGSVSTIISKRNLVGGIKKTNLSSLVTTKQISDKELSKKLMDYEQGKIVVHNKFGEGVIMCREDKYVNIYFPKMRVTKKFELEYMVVNEIINLK